MNDFPNLFSPVDIRGRHYRNRLIAGPTLLAHAVLFIPEIAENVYRMVENRAKGGFGAVSTGEIPVNNEEGTTLFMDRAIDFVHYEGPDFEKFREYADRIKKHGAVSYLEFSHEGSHAPAKPPYQPWGPVAYVREDGVQVQGMDRKMMDKVCEDFRTVSKFAKACGFDGVLFHGGHGFISQQFISPWTNIRTDEFGGSMKNRARFPVMLIDAIREGIGEDMVLEFRFSAEDGVPGGMTISDTVEFCKIIDGKVDIIHVSNGLKWRGNGTQTFSDFFDIHGVNVAHAAKVKKAVTKSKVAVIGGINSPEMAEDIIASGKADFVVLSRQGFADPEFPNKAREGKADYIRRCVRCFQCYPGIDFAEHPTDKPFWERFSPEQIKQNVTPSAMGRCAINPNTGFGFYPDRLPAPGSSKKVLIIGGGAGGLQAALTAVGRGHKVTLIEKTGRLGGLINFTDSDNDKVDIRNFKNLLIREVNESGAKILLNTKVDKSLIEAEKPDVIIAAVGAHPLVPGIPGIETAIAAIDVYNNTANIGKTVALLGGGLVGAEVGLYLASEGRTVTVVEMQDMMAYETLGYYRNALLTEMDKRGIHQFLKTKVTEITKTGVKAVKGGEEIFIPADTCVFSFGMTSNSEMVKEIREMAGAVPVIPVGDCDKSGKMGDAVQAGHMAALSIV
ncbi:MAG: NAD(P)/FAD-dependent oxidoreductase [Treponema sp.]|jgi:2,4-dienoyl-CoA reductase-like NADH-dependent reductase (Old Yellow Enzyme family)/thioredoxin reductase|nr:NAD(P)/FAD-dependent oxidoreductase [Treponema sp.]